MQGHTNIKYIKCLGFDSGGPKDGSTIFTDVLVCLPVVWCGVVWCGVVWCGVDEAFIKLRACFRIYLESWTSRSLDSVKGTVTRPRAARLRDSDLLPGTHPVPSYVIDTRE